MTNDWQTHVNDLHYTYTLTFQPVNKESIVRVVYFFWGGEGITLI